MPDQESVETTDTKDLRKKYEAALAENATLKAERAASQRDAAFREAGVDPADPKAKYFVKAYDGELSAEAIKAEAVAAGLVAPAAPRVDPQVAAETQQILSAVGAPPSAGGSDAAFDAAFAAARTPDEIRAAYVAHGKPDPYV